MEDDRNWFVYVLLNDHRTAYTGIAKDVTARLARHNLGKGAKFTKGRGPWHLRLCLGPMTKSQALKEEWRIKHDPAFKATLKTTLPFHPTPHTLPALPGAYALLLELDHDLPVLLPKQLPHILPPGRYVYCGSANGPGGILSRVSRHMRADKKPHWHIDQLTTRARVLGAWVWVGGNECLLVAGFSQAQVPIPGFGSSDCPHCPSHLLTWPTAPNDNLWLFLECHHR